LQCVAVCCSVLQCATVCHAWVVAVFHGVLNRPVTSHAFLHM